MGRALELRKTVLELSKKLEVAEREFIDISASYEDCERG
jgi:hypothetical protein